MPTLAVPSEAEWHAIREVHVGGSEIASLFYLWRLADGSQTVLHLFEPQPQGGMLLGCCSPYKTGYRLWQEKAGRLKPDDLVSERIDAGHFLEAGIAEWAKAKWGWDKLRKVRRYITHDHVTGWGCSLDYEINEPGRPPVELKNVDGLVFRDQWVADDNGDILVPPLHINLQLQAQIGVAEADHGWIVACVRGNELMRGRIERHGPTQAKIGEAIAALWKAVAEGREPKDYADYETVAKLQSYETGSQAQSLDLSGDDDFARLVRRYRRWKQHTDRVGKHVDLLKGRVADRIGVATKATTVGLKLSWPLITRPAKEVPARWQDELTYRGGLTISQLKD